MPNIQKIDTNFQVQTKLTRKDAVAYNVCHPPFSVYGLLLPQGEGDCFRRIPKAVAEQTSEGVVMLHTNTAGGRVRFATDSGYIAIRVKVGTVGKMSRMALTGSAGFDLYRTVDGKETYLHTYQPDWDLASGDILESELDFKNPQMWEYTLNFPLYSDVQKVEILLDKAARVEQGGKYRDEKPVVYYGSSITQGGCASRPGNAYQSIIARRMNVDYWNLGFSGNAKGELAMAQYIAELSMSAFVYDYDYNAPTLEHLAETHGPFYKVIRQKQPDLPIICISKPFCRSEEDERRRDVIRKTVEDARANGDENIWFINGAEFKEQFWAGDSITVDGCHPNDLGFMCMANVIGEKLKEVRTLKW